MPLGMSLNIQFINKVLFLGCFLILFFLKKTYYNRCGHCKRLKPEFTQAAELMKDDDPPVYLAKVRKGRVSLKHIQGQVSHILNHLS